MEKEYEERKGRLKERYQARKRRYEERYKAEEVKAEVPAPPPVEEKEEEEIKPEVEAPAPVEEEEVVESVLTDIGGIGPTRANKLEGAGIKTIKDLAGATPMEIAEIVGVSIPVASEWIKKAEELT